MEIRRGGHAWASSALAGLGAEHDSGCWVHLALHRVALPS